MVHTPFKPKHQRLILQCYPAGANIDKKPNPSELSYLLYYVSTRRAKLLKVGAFLDKKTKSDAYRGKAGNVQVTLDLLDAIITKCPEHLNIFAENVVNILNYVINSNDIALCLHSTSVFDTFCSNHDSSLFNGDSSYVVLFQSLVDNYISLGSKPAGPNKLQWLYVCIDAIRALASSQIVSSGSGSSYIPTLVSSLLSNLSGLSGSFIEAFENDLAQIENQKDVRRFSYVVPKSEDPHAHDNDSLDTQILYLALEALRSLFDTSSIVQIRKTTRAIIEYVLEKNLDLAAVKTLFVIISRWTPVRFRFLIVLSLMEFIKSDTTTLDHSIRVCSLINNILLSSVNMMGLSVIDVTRTFLVKQLQVLQNFPENDLALKLLDGIKTCLGSLTYHIYYADQVADMVTEILVRCHDSRTLLALNNGSHMFDFNDETNIRTTLQKRSTTITKLVDESRIGSSTPSSSAEGSQAHTETTRAPVSPEVLYHILMSAKKVLEVASVKSISNQRSKVSLFTWRGTEFLMHNADARVRQAYFDTFMTYLQTEISAEEEAQVLKLTQPFVVNKGFFNSFMNEILHLFTSTTPVIAVRQDFVNVQRLLISQIHKWGLNVITRLIPLIISLQEHINKEETVGELRLALLSLLSSLIYNIAQELKLPNLLELISVEIKNRIATKTWYSGIEPPANLGNRSSQDEELSPGESTVSLVSGAHDVGVDNKTTWSIQDLKLSIEPLLSSISENQVDSVFSELQPNIDNVTGSSNNNNNIIRSASVNENDIIVRNLKSLRQLANNYNIASSAASMNSISSPNRQLIIHPQQRMGLNTGGIADDSHSEMIYNHDAYLPGVSDLKHAAVTHEPARYASSILNGNSLRGDNSRLHSLRASSLRTSSLTNDLGDGSTNEPVSIEAERFEFENSGFDEDSFLNDLQISPPVTRGRLVI